MSLTVLHNANFTSQHNVTGKVLLQKIRMRSNNKIYYEGLLYIRNNEKP